MIYKLFTFVNLTNTCVKNKSSKKSELHKHQNVAYWRRNN